MASMLGTEARLQLWMRGWMSPKHHWLLRLRLNSFNGFGIFEGLNFENPPAPNSYRQFRKVRVDHPKSGVKQLKDSHQPL